jgi:hypothetical protein
MNKQQKENEMIKLSYDIVQVPVRGMSGSKPQVTFAKAGVLPKNVTLRGVIPADDGVTLTMAYMAVRFVGWDGDYAIATGLSCHECRDAAADVTGATHVHEVVVTITPTDIHCCVGRPVCN